MSSDSGRLLARGRAADVYADAPGRVRRRYREPHDCSIEVAVMEHVRASGFPVPAVIDVSESEIVMERIDGRLMLEDLVRRPWRVRSRAKLLALLHQRLHRIDPPDWLEARFGESQAVLHLDLHPANVILSPHGPVVIDWTDAAAGPPAADVAQTWVLLATSLVPGSAVQRMLGTAGRRVYLAAFLRQFDRAEVLPHVSPVASARLLDPHLQDPERRAIARMLEKPGVG